MARRKKKLPLWLVAIILIVCAVLYPMMNKEGASDGGDRVVSSVDGTMELHIIDVGQADAILIRCEAGNIIVDAGDRDDDNTVKNYLEALGVQEIEYAIFTHPHADHIGGADTIISSFDINNVIMPDVDEKHVPTTVVYSNMISAIEQKENINVIAAESGAEYSVGEVKMKILSPNYIEKYSELNDYSVVVRVDFGSTSFMLMGDAEAVNDEEMLATYPANELKSTFYKAAHHGARESNTAEFLKAVSPEIIAVSCGEGNSYGHPHAEAMARFEDTGATIYRTDLLGTLKFVSDGTTLTKVD